MTGPMVTPDRETLAKALSAHRPMRRSNGGGLFCSCGQKDLSPHQWERHQADVLLPLLRTTAADAVRAWAEDEALWRPVAEVLASAATSWGEPHDGAEAGYRARIAIRALAAALGGES